MFKTHRLIRAFYPELTWKIKTAEKILYLTFDDGPTPPVTGYVLDELRRFDAKATFFCVGDNIRKHPEILAEIRRNGHEIGNHTYNHLNGWKAPLNEYVENTLACQQAIDAQPGQTKTTLFRPPYGKIRKKQARQLLNNYTIIMWDVLTRDYDAALHEETCLLRSIKATEGGSIVVFHDSLKAEKKLKYILPRYLDHFSSAGYRFDKLPAG